MYCVYLTIYKGNKLPPFYIGYSSVQQVENGYNGSPSSKEFQKTWLNERKTNKHLFRTIIISLCNSKNDAIARERHIHEIYDCKLNPLYINKQNGQPTKLGGFGKDNGMFSKKHTLNSRLMMSISRLGGVVSEDHKIKIRCKLLGTKRKPDFVGPKPSLNKVMGHRGGEIKWFNSLIEIVESGFVAGQPKNKTDVHIKNMTNNLFYYNPLTNETRRFQDPILVPDGWVRGNMSSKGEKSSLSNIKYIKNWGLNKILRVDCMYNYEDEYTSHIRGKYAYVYNNHVSFTLEKFINKFPFFSKSIVSKIKKTHNSVISEKLKNKHTWLENFMKFDEIGLNICQIETYMNLKSKNDKWV
jgi:hypothetical protein